MTLALDSNTTRQYIYDACTNLCVLAGTELPVASDPIWIVQKKGLAAIIAFQASTGYVRRIPQNSQSGDYTLILGDAGKHILHPSADVAARTFTIPANATVAFDIGTVVTFVNQNGAGVVTIGITDDTMRLAGSGATGNRTLAANGVATALKLTATEWIIYNLGGLT